MPPCKDARRLEIAAKIRERRAELGLTQSALGDRIGVAHHFISQWESGRRCPGYMHLPEIAAALRITIDALFGVAGTHYAVCMGSGLPVE